MRVVTSSLCHRPHRVVGGQVPAGHGDGGVGDAGPHRLELVGADRRTRRQRGDAGRCRQAVPVGRVHHPGSLAPGSGMGGQQLGGGPEAPDGDGVVGHPTLHPHPPSHRPPRQRVHAGLEADQAVLAHRTQVALAHHVGALGHRCQGGPVPLGPHGDHLAMGAMHPGSAKRQPGGEGIVHLAGRGEAAPVQHAVAHDGHLALHPALELGTPGWGHDDAKAVVGGEGDGLGVQRHLGVAPHVLAHHRLGPVIDDGGRHPTEVVEGPTVAVPEGDQILGGDKAGERVPAEAQGHVEAPDVHRTVGRVEDALVAPVHLGLGPGQHLEAPVQLGRGRPQPLPGLGHVQLRSLVGATEPVVGHQALVDRGGLQPPFLGQPGVDQGGVGVDHLLPRRPAGGHRRRSIWGVGREVLLHRPPVVAGLPGDLRPGGTGVSQGAKGA